MKLPASPSVASAARWVSRVYLLAAFGLGLASLAAGQIGHFITLLALVVVSTTRVVRIKPLPGIPDGVLKILPHLWALNAAMILQPWWSWILPVFLAAFLLSMLELARDGGIVRNAVCSLPEGLSEALILSLFYILIMASGLKLTFPLTTMDSYTKVLIGAFLVFGSIPITRSAFKGYTSHT